MKASTIQNAKRRLIEAFSRRNAGYELGEASRRLVRSSIAILRIAKKRGIAV